MTPLTRPPVAAACNVADRAVGDAARHDQAVVVPADIDVVLSSGLVVELLASGTVVVTAVGEIDACTAAALSCCLHQAIEDQAAGIVLDLTAVTFFADTGLQVLACAAEHAHADTVSLTICRGPSARYCSITAVVTVLAPARDVTTPAADEDKRKES